MTGYDVFLSFGGQDRAAAMRIAQTLTDSGLTVFVDESIPPGHGISTTVEKGLAAARVLLAYYSADYPRRYACQVELTAAYLAGQREGDPMGRILVVNPESGPEHLSPVELADARYVRAPVYGDKAPVADLVTAVRDRVNAVPGPIGGPGFTEGPRWIADRIAGVPTFVGRYREQWELHSVLHKDRHRMTQHATSNPVVGLLGVAGSGKSALAAAYAYQFGAAYPGGVHWLTLAGATADDALVRYGEELRRVARSWRLGPDIDRFDHADLLAAISDHVFTSGHPALWLIDDLPPDVDRASVEHLLLPASPLLRTLLISRHGVLADFVNDVVELGPLASADAHQLLRAHRPPDTDEEARALDALTARLGGHPFSLNLAGRRLRDQRGLHSIGDYLDHLAADPTVLDPAIDLVRDSVEALDDQQRFILQLATLCGGAPLPARFIAKVVTTLRPNGNDPGDALVGLRERLLATPIADRWEVHAIVREAVQHHLPPAVHRADLAQACADTILTLADDPGMTTAPLAPPAGVLADDQGVTLASRQALHRLLGDYYQSRGEPGIAARHWDATLSFGPLAADDLLHAAMAHLTAGNYEHAIAYAVRAQQGLPFDDPRTFSAVGLLARALDAVGRLSEADPHWETVRAALDIRLSAAPAAESTAGRRGADTLPIDVHLGYLRSRRLRGDIRTALVYATALVERLAEEPPERSDDSLQAARIELATIQLSTNAGQEARRTAESVKRWYCDQGLPDHVYGQEAQSLLAQAWLTLHLLELNPDPANWQEAADSLRRLRERLHERYGPMNAQTLSADVEYGYALLCLGRPATARPHLMETIARLQRRFGPRHPMTLRALLLLGRAHAQQREYEKARDLHEQAYTGMVATLGPNHPDTLHAQYGLGVALVLTGDHRRGGQMFAAVRRTAPTSVGRKSDLYAQSVAATALLTLPGGVWRLVDHLTNQRRDR